MTTSRQSRDVCITLTLSTEVSRPPAPERARRRDGDPLHLGPGVLAGVEPGAVVASALGAEVQAAGRARARSAGRLGRRADGGSRRRRAPSAAREDPVHGSDRPAFKLEGGPTACEERPQRDTREGPVASACDLGRAIALPPNGYVRHPPRHRGRRNTWGSAMTSGPTPSPGRTATCVTRSRAARRP